MRNFQPAGKTISYAGVALAAAVAAGGAAYFLDSRSGALRRALVRDRFHRVARQTREFAGKVSRDARQRARGVYEGATHRHARESNNESLAARVRSVLGRVTSHPRAIQVECSDGVITLRGDILASDVAGVMRSVARVRGVNDVKDELRVYESAAHIPALQGKTARRRPRFEYLQDNWAPAPRVLAATAGLSLAAAGLLQRSATGYGLAALGAALVLRSASNIPLTHLVGLRASEQDGVLVQKTLEIYAEPNEIYSCWRDLERLPEFMSHIRTIHRIDDRRYRWVVDGPGGAPVEWEAEITADVPDELIAWRTSPDSLVQSSGVVQFEPTAYGGTRVHVRMTYRPPANAVGHALAKVFGRDPKRQMDADLLRFKSFMETGAHRRSETSAVHSTLQ